MAFCSQNNEKETGLLSDSTIKVIGLGGAGRHCLLRMKKTNLIADTLLIHDDEMDTFKNQLQVYEPKGKLVFSRLGNDSKFIIVTSLAGKMCTTYLESILQNVHSPEKNIYIIGIMPFEFEGKELCKTAHENLNLIKNLGVKYTLINNDGYILRPAISNMSLKQTFETISDDIITEINSIKENYFYQL